MLTGLISFQSHLNGSTNAQGYDALPLISALNFVLQQNASRTGIQVRKTRYFSSSSAQKISLGPRVEAWQGFFASVCPMYKQLMVDVNVCMTASVEPFNLPDALRDFPEEQCPPCLIRSRLKHNVSTIRRLFTKLGPCRLGT
ncbi:hypothetical protein L208DRAFT_1411565 [Tricholoma matsutake]|nr:hypothetical protein L208DRAFT_1411565 [Tricholoma matsutake 945]